MASLCKTLALDTTSPVPFFVMEHIFLDIARHWEDRPLPVEEAKLVEARMMKTVEDLVEGIEAFASIEQIYILLNGVVSDYLISF
ncbi:hypothetical protein ACFLT0_01120 [Chloroflexota bacterium]